MAGWISDDLAIARMRRSCFRISVHERLRRLTGGSHFLEAGTFREDFRNPVRTCNVGEWICPLNAGNIRSENGFGHLVNPPVRF